MKRLLEAWSQDSTSASMASRYSSLYHSMTFAVLSESMAGVLPSASRALPPFDQRIDQNVVLASAQWLMAIPTGLPCFLSAFPILRSSSHVLGGFSKPAFLKCATL